MMLQDYNVHAMLLAEGSGHVQVPSSHPAFAELEKGRVKPVGAIRDDGWVYLFRLRDWNRLAADQRSQLQSHDLRSQSQPQRLQPVRSSAYRERPLEQPLHT